ncbi:MAG TPA: hypothetical protein PLE77_14940 [Kiritimatiellia bacterium]|nr:hypothetical protein [Kiritimatiellia bacterium]
MSDLDILSQMIRASARIAVEPHYDRHKAVLTEPQCPASKVEIRNIPPDAVIIVADKFPEPNGVFDGSRGECKRADYIIVAEKSGRTVAVYVELKCANNATAADIQNQLRGAHCVFCYCQAIGRDFWNEQRFLQNAVYRFVSFGHTGSIRKRGTRETRHAAIHDRPDRLLKLDWATSVEFNRITGQV